MITKELVTCLETELSKGTTYDIVRAQTIQAGWTPEDFDEAITKLPISLQEKVLMVTPQFTTLPLRTAPLYPKRIASRKGRKLTIVVAIALIAGVMYGYMNGYLSILQKATAQMLETQ
jgi:hypothetical protein